MALREINETFDELKEEQKSLLGKKDGLLVVYDLLNKPLPDDVVKIIQDATKNSEEYRSGRERFVNRVICVCQHQAIAGSFSPIALMSTMAVAKQMWLSVFRTMATRLIL